MVLLSMSPIRVVPSAKKRAMMVVEHPPETVWSKVQELEADFKMAFTEGHNTVNSETVAIRKILKVMRKVGNNKSSSTKKVDGCIPKIVILGDKERTSPNATCFETEEPGQPIPTPHQC